MKRFIRVLIIYFILISNYSALKSQTFQSGDVFVAEIYNSPTPGVNWFSPNGTLITNINSYPFYQYSYSLAFDKSGYLYVGDAWFNSNIAKIDSQGNYTGDFLTGLERPNRIVFDSSGNVYVGFNFDGSTGGIKKYDSNGNFIRYYTQADLGIVFGMDLGKDQCTMFYIHGNTGVVRRWDVCSNTPLPDFTINTFGGALGRLKLRINEEVFISTPANGKILRFDSSGKLIQYYVFQSPNALSFDPDQTSFWTVTYSDEVVRFEIETGQILNSFTASTGNSSFDIIVKDEILAATSDQPTIPDSTSLSLQPTDTLYQTNIPLYFEIPIRNNHGVPCMYNYLDIQSYGVNGYSRDSAASDQFGNAHWNYTGLNAGNDTIIGTLRSNGFKDTVIITWDAVLPVELSSFTSSTNNNIANLNWSVTSEQNNFGFDIERKNISSNEWIIVGYVAGKGTVSASNDYSFSDRNLSHGKYNYRLKQIDFNGNFEYYILTEVVEIGYPLQYGLSQNYPNPFNPVTKINFDIPKESFVTLKVFDLSGKEVAKIINESMQAGYYTVDFNSSILSSGIYFYKLESGNFVKAMKMIILK
ncbi:MAG: T9SS type A sorting domain-containing protein [Bacteroidota bacterium]|nr:T9SS type A sorting domain-containing protein [Bacteroidota bacterium]